MPSTHSTVSSKNEHQKVWDLLPWYINHSLNASEQEIVKTHVKTCLTCRIELAQQQQVFEKIQQTDLLTQVSQASLAQLRKRIVEQDRSSHIEPYQQVSKQPESSARQIMDFLKYGALAASLAILSMPFMLATENQGSVAEYRTLANPSEKMTDNRLRVVFSDESSATEIEAILSAVSGHIVKGPSLQGVYEVQIENQKDTVLARKDFMVRDAITLLRRNPSVLFVDLVQ